MEDIKKSLDKIENKLEKMDDHLSSIDRTLVSHDASLREHMRRTQLAEENIELLRQEFKPVSTHVAIVSGIGKVITFLSVVVGIIFSIGRMLGLW